MRISAFCTAVLAYVVIGHAPPAAAQVDQQRAQEYFKDARRSASATVGGAAAGRVVREGARRGDYEAVRQQP
jgi:hypothetical protein